MKLIDKNKLLEELKKLKQNLSASPIVVIEDVESLVESLKVKEVDLEKEIDDYMNEHFSECADGVLISDANSTELTLLDAASIARHFYELGLKEELKNK